MQFDALIDEVQALANRVSDTFLTDTRVGLWVNMAYKRIIRRNPGIREVHASEKIWLVEDQYQYPLSGLTKDVANLRSIRWIDPSQRVFHSVTPYKGGLVSWNTDNTYIPNNGTGIASEYFLRGNTIELEIMPGVNEVVVSATGATAADSSGVTTVTKTAAFTDLVLAGKEVYLTGTNVTRDYYTIASNTDDTITLDESCLTAATGTAITVNIGACLEVEFDELPADLTSTASPIITDFDLAIIYLALSIGQRSPTINDIPGATENENYANYLIADRLAGERPKDRATRNPYQGP